MEGTLPVGHVEEAGLRCRRRLTLPQDANTITHAGQQDAPASIFSTGETKPLTLRAAAIAPLIKSKDYEAADKSNQANQRLLRRRLIRRERNDIDINPGAANE